MSRQPCFPRPWPLVLLVLALLLGPGGPAARAAQAKPPWWDQAAAAAAEGGYRLIDYRGLRAALAKLGGDVLLIDVRPDYEFQRGHIPGAVNLEFHLGHRNRLPEPMARALRRLAGDDLSRPIIVYCRSFK